ncbi:MAG: flavin reductase [Sphingobacteriia bacterium 24-36-13]|jgi:flavin reductase (DIM6/NTAB) family NADH-FMN oxidoreductase RutF|uniref:flavin reductase family protein n=1 Tax=Sediminibacterium sp. TaxID=1917865 RepID=UPI000BD1184D|nr:flavin reductase family protein [Sediminibacterium sp.]OYY11728.1 MAG: flavin reductase [Sphingobacteriia bacterium 35-36-14]OYZ53871.1 MAG: flavin reductase [Sphingobacteriia bacterium 24-36-13]OZA63144.1 MAG: flavin reductase [Sphingobacteriia bacterium 39-36-14]HQS23629.1 flavin reductase family protein [Sediminibacterium sp.]HQS34466.1 flavin reductase family protein [Sediminibacterium sp.]
MKIVLSELPIMQKQAWLQHAIAPRPICFASTIDEAGNSNLSPFSFFNLFSSNPPIVVFSPARKGRDNTTKHTLDNVLAVPECVINIVDYSMVQQMSLSSCEYPKGVDEFIKAGFTKEAATMVKPPMVKEAKIKLECKINEVKSLGDQGGAGQLVIAEVLCMHIDDAILNAEGTMIDQTKLALVARLGGDWYCKVNSQNLFKVAKPNTALGIGIDAIPESIKSSSILTGNHLGQLGNVNELPSIDPAFHDDRLKNIIQYYSINPNEMEQELHKYAAELLNQEKVQEAWQILLSGTL